MKNLDLKEKKEQLKWVHSTDVLSVGDEIEFSDGVKAKVTEINSEKSPTDVLVRVRYEDDRFEDMPLSEIVSMIQDDHASVA